MSYVLPLPSLVIPVPEFSQSLVETNLERKSSTKDRGQEDDISSEDGVIEAASNTSHYDDCDQCADLWGGYRVQSCCARCADTDETTYYILENRIVHSIA